MTFFGLIFKNIFRHKWRTILTAFGISIGIATIIVFSLATSGIMDAFQTVMNMGDADFTVAKADAADIVLSFLDKKKQDEIASVEGVKEIIPLVMSFAQVSGNPYFMIYGQNANQLEIGGTTIKEGRAYASDDELMIGKIYAKNKDLGVGDKLTINKKEYKITGIYETGTNFTDAGATTTLAEAQKIQGITDKVNMVSVVVDDNYSVQEVADRIEAENSDLVSIVDLNDFNAINQGQSIMNSITWGISLLAIVIGAIGVMNTIIMSVMERTREIGVLRALGWGRGRIILMILAESFVIGIIAGVIGGALGVAFILALGKTEFGEAWLNIKFEPVIFAQAMGVSIAVVIVGALYPSYRASKLLPTEALRYE